MSQADILSNLFILIVPVLAAGIMFVTLLPHLYLTYRQRAMFHATISVVTINAILYVTLQALVTIRSLYLGNWEGALEVHRLQQLLTVLFIPVLPIAQRWLLPEKTGFSKSDKIVIILSFLFAIGIITVALWSPSLFLVESLDRNIPSNPLLFRGGMEGPLYVLRDLLLALVMTWTLIKSAAHTFRTGNYMSLLIPGGAILFGWFAGIHDLLIPYIVDSPVLPSGMQCNLISIGFMVIAVFLLTTLSYNLSVTFQKLNKASTKAAINEHRYQSLLQDYEGIILLLNDQNRIIHASKEAKGTLDALKNPDIMWEDIFLHESRVPSVESDIRNGYLAQARKGESVSFTETLLGTQNRAIEYSLDLKGFPNGDIILRAHEIADDIPDHALVFAKQRFSIGNSPWEAEKLSRHLVRNLAPFLPSATLQQVRLGLREILVNAIEHGNLGITFDEKSEMKNVDDYLTEIEKRQQHTNSKVMVESSLNQQRVAYKIADEGKGFDYEARMARIESDNTMPVLTHGRGLLLARAIFDEITWNRKGNQVLLIKNFS